MTNLSCSGSTRCRASMEKISATGGLDVDHLGTGYVLQSITCVMWKKRQFCSIAITYRPIGRKYWTQRDQRDILDPSQASEFRPGRERFSMDQIDPTQRKRPARASLAPESRILVGRIEAAEMLSISCRALDYLVSSKQLSVRRIGARVLIAVADLKRFSGSDHPDRLAG